MNSNFFIKGKSEVNFCEKDCYSEFNGELWNVITSIIMSLFGLYGVYISCKNSMTNKTKSITLNILLCLIGLGSAYFHFELSLFAHWIDIILISIILIYSLYCIDQTNNKNIFYSLIFLCHLITSLYIPQIHIFIQFITGFIVQNKIQYILSINTLCQNDSLLQRDYLLTKKIFGLSLLFWIIDYFGCILINPYHTHWIFQFSYFN